jgi:hypothetical protein
MVDRYSYNSGQPSTLNRNTRAAQFRNAFLSLGHESKGFAAEEIDSRPIPFTNNRIDVTSNAMVNGNLCVLFADVGSRFAVGRKNIITRAAINTVNDREPLSWDTCRFQKRIKYLACRALEGLAHSGFFFARRLGNDQSIEVTGRIVGTLKAYEVLVELLHRAALTTQSLRDGFNQLGPSSYVFPAIGIVDPPDSVVSTGGWFGVGYFGGGYNADPRSSLTPSPALPRIPLGGGGILI